MIMENKTRQMTLEELEKQTQEKLNQDWRITVRLMPNGHTQIRSTRKQA